MVVPLIPVLGAVLSTYLVTTEFIKPSGAVTETDKEVVSRLRTMVDKVGSIETKLDGLKVGDETHSDTHGELLAKLRKVETKNEKALSLLGQLYLSDTQWGERIVEEVKDAKKADSDGRERVLTKLSGVSTAESDEAKHGEVMAKLRRVSESGLVPSVKDLNERVNQMLKDMAVPRGEVRKGRVLRLERLTRLVYDFSLLNERVETLNGRSRKQYDRLFLGMMKVAKQLTDSKELDYNPIDPKVGGGAQVKGATGVGSQE